MMNSRERVLTVFEHQQPDRVPCWFGASAEFLEKAQKELNLDNEGLLLRFGDDFRRVFAEYSGPNIPLTHKESTYRTIFGVERTGMGYGQPISHPLANASLKEIHDYPWPSPKWMDVTKIKDAAQVYNREYAILGGDWSPFWHDAIDLLGMENLYIKMYSEPVIVDAIFSHLVDYYFEVSKRIFDAASDMIDIFFLGNDFGSQAGPLLGPDLFRRFFLPHLKRLCDLGHSYGLKNQMHCCGGIFELIPLFIEAGLDGIHSLQPDCRGMDLKKIKKEFGSRIVLNGGIDSHNILINGTAEFVRMKTREILGFMKPGSGYIAGASHDTILEETPVENVLAMFDTIKEYGSYS